MTASHESQHCHYLDNGATSWPKPDVVYETLDTSFRTMFSAKRGSSKASREGSLKLDGARQAVADLFNIADSNRVCFTSGCTHSTNMAIQALNWQEGDAVVMSAVEHHAISRPIRKIARERGVEFFVVPYTNDMPFDLAYFEDLLKTKPNIKLVATTHASNVIGCILPVTEIGALCKQYNVPYLLDAAQSGGVLNVDVQAMNITMLALAGHKSLYGPPGIGVLYMGEHEKLDWRTFMEGGTGGDSGKHPMAAEPPNGFEVGTIPLPQILALAEGVKWVSDQEVEYIHAHETNLLKALLEGLNTINGITIYGSQDISTKTPVVSFNLDGHDPQELGALLYDEFGIALRGGFHCAPMAHESIGTVDKGGTLRASLGAFTKKEDVQALITALTTVSARKSPVNA